MNILIVGYYYLADGYLAASKGLEDLGNIIDFLPIYHYINNKIEYLKLLIKKINKNDLVIWWHNSTILSEDKWYYIKKYTKTKIIQLDWDPGYSGNNNYIHWIKTFKNKQLSNKLFDKIYCVNAKIVNIINKKYKTNKFEHFYPGFHPNMSYYNFDKKYVCDISIICTNLYENVNLWENTKICRKDLVDFIYNLENINFHFYGPEKFKNIYPKAYKYFISYEDCYKVFSNSKINLNISPVGDTLNDIINNEKKIYISERCPQILACKGLMVCDTDLSPLLIPFVDYIKIDKIDDFKLILIDILKNNNKYDKMRQNGYIKAKNNLQWKDTINKFML